MLQEHMDMSAADLEDPCKYLEALCHCGGASLEVLSEFSYSLSTVLRSWRVVVTLPHGITYNS